MAMQRWDPFSEMTSLRDAMSQLLERSLVPPMGTVGGLATAPMDVYTEGDHYVIEMALPGVPPDAVEVSVLGNQVTVRGEIPAAEAEQRQGRAQLVRERPRGRFERTITLPTEVDADKAEARFEHGMLYLTIPKAEAARARRIPIGGASTAPALHGAPATPGASGQAASGRRVQSGMAVVGSDGAQVGTVKEVRDRDFLVDRPMHRDTYIPESAVREATGSQVVLTIPADQVDQQGWPSPPLA
jgi:HSP20 family protein